MTNQQLKNKLTHLVKEERRITNEVLELVSLAMERRAYLEFGFANIFDWLTRGLGYSQGSAQRRIDAARMVRAVPEVKEKIASGELNLTNIGKVQAAIRAQEKVRVVSAEERKRAVNAVENLSRPDAEKKLMEIFPAARSSVHQEKRVTIDEHTTRHSMNLSNKAAADLRRAKEVLSHKFPKATDAEIVAYALECLLEKADPIRRDTATVAVESKAGLKRAIHKSSSGQCTYADPKTGERCTSRYQVQVDHKIPRATGGKDEKENLRLLCRQHNLFEAERILGREAMAPFWPRK